MASPIAILGSALVGWYDAADTNRRYQKSLGYLPATDDDVIGLLMDKSQSGSPSGMYKGLDLSFDYYIDATNGSDGNAGTSAGAAWASLSKISDISLGAGVSAAVLVKSDTYDTADDYVVVDPSPGLASSLTIVFEPGCVMDGTAANAIAPTNGFEMSRAKGAWTSTIYGNGLQINNYAEGTAASPNGFGNRADNISYVYDVHCDNCDDGFSCHGDASLYLYDCSAKNSEKGTFLHVDNAYVEAHRCNFIYSMQGDGAASNGVEIHIYDCILEPETSGLFWDFRNTTATRCQIGTSDKRVTVSSSLSNNLLTNCYLNLYCDANSYINIRECYGKFSARVRSGGGVTIENSIITAPASGQSNIIFSNFDPGSSAKFVVNNNIFKGSAFMSVDATNAAYLVTAASELFNNILTGSAAYDSDLIAADSGGTVIVGTITSDPLIGAANTLLMADYAYGDGSPAIGAAYGGGNIGFGASDVAELVAAEARGPDGVAGNHASQSTDANRPTLTGGYIVHSGSDALSATFDDLGVDATIGYVTSGGVTWLDDQTISGATDLVPAADWREMVVADGAVSSDKRARIEAWFAR